MSYAKLADVAGTATNAATIDANATIIRRLSELAVAEAMNAAKLAAASVASRSVRIESRIGIVTNQSANVGDNRVAVGDVDVKPDELGDFVSSHCSSRSALWSGRCGQPRIIVTNHRTHPHVPMCCHHAQLASVLP